MKNEQEYFPNDALLTSYLAGETNPDETAQVEAWIAASKKNRAHFESLKKTWDALEPASEKTVFDADAAWSRLKVRMHQPEEKKSSSRIYLRIAAAVTLFVIISGSVFLYLRPSSPEIRSLAFVSSEATTQDTLPDGSIVTLNRNSRLTYPSSFTGQIREVTLSGEAFFEVQKDPAHPFIIHTTEMDIKVVGTSFNVRAYPKSDSMRVTVKTGKVLCYAANDSVVLLPGEIADYNDHEKKLVKKSDDDPNSLSYRTRIFEFSDTRLTDAVRALNNVYGTSINLKSDKIEDCRLNTTFKNESIDNIIIIISSTFGLSVERNGKVIVFDGEGCHP